MKFREDISRIQRYLINDQDRSDQLRLDKNEFNIPFPEGVLDSIKDQIDEYLFQAYPSTWNTLNHASELLEHDRPDEILLVPGSDYALKLCYEAFLGKDGGTVGLPDPTYAMNDVYATLSGADILRIGYGRDWQLNRTELMDKMALMDLFVLANPNQPTGMAEQEQFLLEIVSHARRHNVWVVVDEAYYSFCGMSLAGYVNEFDNLIITRSFSKSYGIAGMRVGAVLACADTINYLAKALPVYCVNAVALGLLKILSHHKNAFDLIHQEFKSVREDIIAFYRGVGLFPLPSQTNFVMVETDGKINAGDYIQYLKDNGILIRGPWVRPPYKDAFRVSVSSLENIATLFDRTREYLG